MKKICPICHISFEAVVHNKKYCSQICYLKAHEGVRKAYYHLHRDDYLKRNAKRFQLHKHPCPTCGKPISEAANYCAKHAGTGRSGPDNHGWKGGIQHSNGYIRILKPEHPRANSEGSVAQHIVAWEEAHKRLLPKGWVIHHLNGIKTDNRPRNLVALENRRHALVLSAKAKRIQELEARLKTQGLLC